MLGGGGSGGWRGGGDEGAETADAVLLYRRLGSFNDIARALVERKRDG